MQDLLSIRKQLHHFFQKLANTRLKRKKIQNLKTEWINVANVSTTKNSREKIEKKLAKFSL